jgi:hypothetical protein
MLGRTQNVKNPVSLNTLLNPQYETINITLVKDTVEENCDDLCVIIILI